MPAKMRCFFIVSSEPRYERLVYEVNKAARSSDVEVVTTGRAGEILSIFGGISPEIAQSDFILAEDSQQSPNTFYELGLAHAMGKPVVVLVERQQRNERPQRKKFPLTLQSLTYIHYEFTPPGLKRLKNELKEIFTEIRRSPSRFLAGVPLRPSSLPFYIDWEKFGPREFENLCFELLNQMGFRRLQWGKESREIDAIATLPKKDPDGYEYEEVWFISMGLHSPHSPDMVIRRLWKDPDYFFRSLAYKSERGELLLTRMQSGVPITFLFIWSPGWNPLFEKYERNIEDYMKEARWRLFKGKGDELTQVRFRIWSRDYLTNLIKQYPQIGYKYFSDEGRTQAKYRKTPEELYKENVALSESLQAKNAVLEEEKNRRISAERDAVWKDLSFAAAHKLGNPLFAIENYLDPLQQRIESENKNEGLEIVVKIRDSVEKSKAIIDQFKSLTAAQKIKLQEETKVVPIIEHSCAVAKSNGIAVTIKVVEACPQVMADPYTLAECFDELVANAQHWFDKSEKKIEVIVSEAKERELAPNLETDQAYLLIHFRDNGPGIPFTDKERIFDAFYSTYAQGTGLGLALVRRIIEGHGGTIIETGQPGRGADFEIFLQPAPQKNEDASEKKQKNQSAKSKE